ncbi:MAG: beta-ketoacyl-ACP synthase II [bacterium]
MPNRRVVVTGLGAITAIGNDLDTYWDSLINGKSGITKVTRFNIDDYSSQIGAEVKNFDVTKYINPKKVRRMDLFTHYGISASEMAIKDSGLNMEKEDLTRIGTIISSGIGGMNVYHTEHKKLLEQGPKRVSPFFIPMMIPDITAGYVSIEYGFLGPNYATVSACASGAHGIGNSYLHILNGDADIMITGGTESVITEMAYAGFCRMKALSTRNNDPQHASRPFDKDRDGFVIGEGAGIIVLEELSHAKKRGAKIYAELAGFGYTGDAYHITAPHPEGKGAALAMKRAMETAKLNLQDVDHINAHGTSTPPNDPMETKAIKSVFDDHAKKLAVSSNKSMIGHLLGASGAAELISTAITIKQGIIPPTINYETPDPECDLDYVPNNAREQKVKAALSNSFGFGGHNVCLALKRFED